MASSAPTVTGTCGCTTWVTLQADNFEAVLPAQDILAYTGSFIADLARMALGHAEQSSLIAPIRLNCSSEVLKEVVQYIRETNGLYRFPADADLCFRVRRQLNYLGLNQGPSLQDTLIFLNPSCGHDIGLPKLFKYQLNPSATALTISSALVGPARQHTTTVCPHLYGDVRKPCEVEWMVTKAIECSGMCVSIVTSFGYGLQSTEATIRRQIWQLAVATQ